MLTTMKRIILTLAIAMASAFPALAQNQGTTRLFPPIDDLSLVNHQPWACTQLTAGCAFNVITPNPGIDQSAQIQAALNGSKTLPVMLVGGPFISCTQLQVPNYGTFLSYNTLAYDPFFGTEANTYLSCNSTFHGTSFVAFTGLHGGLIRDIAIDDNYTHQTTFVGSISGTTLSVASITSSNLSPTITVGQSLQDAAGHIAMTTQITALGTCGNPVVPPCTFSVWPSQTVASETMGATVHCFENIHNASFTTAYDIQGVRCTGDGYHVVADGNQPGGQGIGGAIIRPLIGGAHTYLSLNVGAGLRVDQVNNGFASDLSVQCCLNAASNSNNGFFGQSVGDIILAGTTGQYDNLRTEQDGACGVVLLNSGYLTLSNLHVDSNSCVVKAFNSSLSLIGGDAFNRFTGVTAIQLFNSTMTMQGFFLGPGYSSSIQADATSHFSGWFGGTNPGISFADPTSELVVGPGLINSVGGNPPATVTLTGAAFAAPDLLRSANSIFALNHAGCAGGTGGHCSVPNPTFFTKGTNGVFEIQQSLTGNDTITWGSAYVNAPTLSTGAGAVDYVPWYVNSVGQVVLEAPNQNRLVTTPVPAQPNIVTLPLSFAGGVWGGGTPTAGQLDPEGGTTAVLFTEDSSTGYHGISTNVTGAAGTYTASFFFKVGATGATRYANLQINSTTTNDQVQYQVNPCNNTGASGGEIVASGCIMSPNGYGRVYLTVAAPSALSSVIFFMGDYSNYTYTGDGVSNGYFWGPIMRAGNAP
jgi:hypothetical protein